MALRATLAERLAGRCNVRPLRWETASLGDRFAVRPLRCETGRAPRSLVGSIGRLRRPHPPPATLTVKSWPSHRPASGQKKVKVSTTPASRSVVFEDALAGVAAGRAGGFGWVVGVDRGGQAAALRAGGADVVVSDLADLPGQP